MARASTTQELGVASVQRLASASVRVGRAWQRLAPERRLAAGACIGLVASLFLPWYQETVVARSATGLLATAPSVTGWGAFSFAEAALLLIAGGVLSLLFRRAEGRAFRLPGGDGAAITAAGGTACLLIVWRMFDKPGTSGQGALTATAGIEWGILVALALAGLLAYAGTRIRRAPGLEPDPAVAARAGARRAEAASGAARVVASRGAGRAEAEPTAAQRGAAGPSGAVTPATPAGQARRRPRRRAGDRPPQPGLDPSEIAALELPEPPTIRVGRAGRAPEAPAAAPEEAGDGPGAGGASAPTGDQLTLGFEPPS